MRLVKVVVLILVPSLFCLAGCNNRDTQISSGPNLAESPSWIAGKEAWQDLAVGKSTRADVALAFNTPVTDKDRYAYALDEEQPKSNSFLMMVDLDEDGIVTAKYYWEWISTSAFLARVDSWEMAVDTQIPASVIQEYTATLGPREEAILEYFGRRLYGIAAHFEHLRQVFGATASMKRILTLAATEYNMRADKQALLSERGVVFDGDVFGDECTISLRPIDEQAGWYFLVLKGRRTRNFFSGW